jgi:hypothetical protein
VSSPQVSRHVDIVLDMQSRLDRPELVRCLACLALYEQAVVSPESATETATCPHCGDIAWLAASIPIEESAAAAPA